MAQFEIDGLPGFTVLKHGVDFPWRTGNVITDGINFMNPIEVDHGNGVKISDGGVFWGVGATG